MLSPTATIAARDAFLSSSRIGLGTSDTLPGLVLSQAQLGQLASLHRLTLTSRSTIDIYSGITLGGFDANGVASLERLTLDAAAIVARAGGTSTLNVREALLENTIGGSATSAPGGLAASLAIVARDPQGLAAGRNRAKIALGSGSVGLTGFSDITFASSGDVAFEGDGGKLSVGGALALDAPRITAGSVTVGTDGLTKFGSASYKVDASGQRVAFLNASGLTSQSAALADPMLGGRIDLKAQFLDIGDAATPGAQVVLPGGVFTATTAGPITIRSGGIDVAARAVQFRDLSAAIDGGSIKLASDTAGISILAGARLDVSGRAATAPFSNGAAGSIALLAPEGDIAIAEDTLLGASPAADDPDRGGSFTYLSKSAVDFDRLAGVLGNGGFTKRWSVRTRIGDIAVGSNVRVRELGVSADTGDITVASTIDASGATGGRIELWAGRDLRVWASAVLDAHGDAADAAGYGGEIVLGAGSADATKGIIIADGAKFYVGVHTPWEQPGVGPSTDRGRVTLRTPRTAVGHDVNIAASPAALSGIVGARDIVVEANRVYSYDRSTLILEPTVLRDTMLADAKAYMGDMSWVGDTANDLATHTIKARLAGADAQLASLLRVQAGIEVRNTGDILVIGDALNPLGIDLSGGVAASNVGGVKTYQGVSDPTWPGALQGHFGPDNEPIALTLRAGGNLDFGQCSNATCDGSRAYTIVTRTGGTTTTTTRTLADRYGILSDGFSAQALIDNGLQGFVTDNLNVLYGEGSRPYNNSGVAGLFDAPAQGGKSAPQSASFRLGAGQDLASANPLAVEPGRSGSVTLAGATSFKLPNQNQTLPLVPGPYFYNPAYYLTFSESGAPRGVYRDFASLIRTGTGDISIAAAGDLTLKGPAAAIYTAGAQRSFDGCEPDCVVQPLPGFKQLGGFGDLTWLASAFLQPGIEALPQFGSEGGNIRLDIGGDVRGASLGLTYELTARAATLALAGVLDPGVPAYQIGDGGEYRIALLPAYLRSVYPDFDPSLQIEIATALSWFTSTRDFSQGIGAFGGGNVSVTAGGKISDIQLVLPTNARAAGADFRDATASYQRNTDNPQLSKGLLVQGGGDLRVIAGADISNVDMFVESGKTLLRSGGSVTAALQTGTGEVSVQALRDITIADRRIILERRPYEFFTSNPERQFLTVPGLAITRNGSALAYANSRQQRTSTGGRPLYPDIQDIFTNDPVGAVRLEAAGNIVLDVHETGTYTGSLAFDASRNVGTETRRTHGILPAQLSLLSLQGDITNKGRFITYPDAEGRVDILARGSVVLREGFVVSDVDPAIMPTIEGYARLFDNAAHTAPILSDNFPNFFVQHVLTAAPPSIADRSLSLLDGEWFPALVRRDAPDGPIQEVRHDDGWLTGSTPRDRDPIRIYALEGDIDARQTSNRVSATIAATLNLPKAADLYAGRDILSLTLIGQNLDASDVTSLIAGRDIAFPTARRAGGAIDTSRRGTSGVFLSGPGDLLMVSGRDTDLGLSAGIVTIGDLLNPHLPSRAGGNGQGASITSIVGVDLSGINYDRFMDAFANPLSAAASPFAQALVVYDKDGAVFKTGNDALAWLQGLSEEQRRIQLNRLFFSLVRNSGREHSGAAPGGDYALGLDALDAVDVRAATYPNYERAYATIESLFGGVSGHGQWKGTFSTARTRAGGDISLLAPFGGIDVGAIRPPQGFSYAGDPLGLGVVTEQGGSIRMYADGDIAVNQSRVFTVGGGDELLISRHGNIDAGRGAKTVLAIQPPLVQFDKDGNLRVTLVGPASGSGIAVLKGLPTTPRSKADLIAFEGAVDAGDAGIRVSGNLSIAALQVLNAANIQIGGQASGVPMIEAPNIGGLTSASNASGAASQGAAAPSNEAREQPSIIIVEVIGYGGGGNESTPSEEDKKRRRPPGQQGSYDPKGAVQVLGFAGLSDAETTGLTEDEARAIKY